MDVAVGDRIPDWVIPSVDAEKMKTMAALLRDPNPIHWDVASVQRLGMGDRVVNQGPTNMAYVVNALIAWSGDPAAVRSVQVRFQGNVLAGDHVTAGGQVTEVREADGARLAVCDVWLDRDDGARLLAGAAEVVVG